MVSKKKRCITCNKNILCNLYKKRSAKCNKCLYQMRKEYISNYLKTEKGKESRKRWYLRKQEEKIKEKNIKKAEEKTKENELLNIKRYIFLNKPFLKVICIYGPI